MDAELKALELRMERFENRVTDRLDAMDHRLAGMESKLEKVERRLDNVERDVSALNSRVDGLAGDMRQRFRVLSDRVGGIERRLVA